MFQIQSKSQSVTIKQFDTLLECKLWFQNLCNIPWHWKVITPNNETLDGREYQSWE